MSKNSSYNTKQLFIEKLAAFMLFLEEGMEAVQRMYPQHVAFVRSHKDKSSSEVKRELLQSQAA